MTEPAIKKPIHPAVDDLNKLGNRLAAERKWEAACVAMKRALALEPASAELWCNLGGHLWPLRRHKEALEALERSIELDPELRAAWLNIALVYEAERQFDLVDMAIGKALEIDPHYHAARWNRSLLWLNQGEYEKGFRDYDARLEFKKDSIYPSFAARRWNGDDLTGKSIYIAPEQGMGDSILFSRFLPWLASLGPTKIYLSFPSSIQSLLWEFKSISCIEFWPEGVPVPNVDFVSYIGSLPRWYFASNTQVPADPGLILKRCRTQLATQAIKIPRPPGWGAWNGPAARRIGICWSGNIRHERNPERSIMLESLLELAEDPLVWLVGLQAGPMAADIGRLGAGDLILNNDHEMQMLGMSGTGSAMLQLDLVVTVCTSVAHLAGALGVPTIVLLSKDYPYWTWGYDSENTPWYPNVKIIRQETQGNWRPVIDKLKDYVSNIYSTTNNIAAA